MENIVNPKITTLYFYYNFIGFYLFVSFGFILFIHCIHFIHLFIHSSLPRNGDFAFNMKLARKQNKWEIIHFRAPPNLA